jgi:hypothetical protein
VTLRDIERSVYRRLNKGVNPPNAETQARIRLFINERHRRILRDYPQLRDDVIAFDTVASQPQYSIPEQGIARINRIFETTNDRLLEQRSLLWLRSVDPDPQESTPYVWVPNGYMQVHTQPDDASEVFVVSTSASDVNRCYIEGMVTGGDRRIAEVTMTGVTAVSLDATIATWTQIDKFYLSEAAVGSVTLHADSGAGDELSQIAIGDTSAKFISFTLYPTPSDVITYTADIMRGIGDMSNPLDEPLLPADFHDLLAIGARLDEYEHTDDNRRRLAEVEWDEGLKALTSWIVATPSTRIDLNGIIEPRPSRLGPWYPSGS